MCGETCVDAQKLVCFHANTKQVWRLAVLFTARPDRSNFRITGNCDGRANFNRNPVGRRHVKFRREWYSFASEGEDGCSKFTVVKRDLYFFTLFKPDSAIRGLQGGIHLALIVSREGWPPGTPCPASTPLSLLSGISGNIYTCSWTIMSG